MLLHVAPPLLFTVTSFPAMPTNNLAVPSPSLGYVIAINVICGIHASKISRLFLHQYVLFQLAQLFICGNTPYRFPNCWNWQICHAHRAFRIQLCTLCGKLQTFPMVKSKTNWISSPWNTKVHSSSFLKSSAWVTSGRRAAKRPLCSLFKSSWHVLPYRVHVPPL